MTDTMSTDPAYHKPLKISRDHSINRVKQTRELADRKIAKYRLLASSKAPPYPGRLRRACRVTIDCQMWLGTWGLVFG
jgi:hypothetical protein